MIVQKGSMVFDALCLWDIHDTPILNFLWANLDTHMAAVATTTLAVHKRVEIGRFAFVVYSIEQMQTLNKVLPLELQAYIMLK